MEGQSKFETEFRREEKFWRDCSEKLSEAEYAAKMAEFLGEDFDQDFSEEDIIEDIIDGEKAKTELPPQFEACFREQKLFWKNCKRTLKVRDGACCGPGRLEDLSVSLCVFELRIRI